MRLFITFLTVVLMSVTSFAGLRAVVRPQEVSDTISSESISLEDIRAAIRALNQTSFMVSNQDLVVEPDGTVTFVDTGVNDTSVTAGNYDGRIAKVREIIDAVTSGNGKKVVEMDINLLTIAIAMLQVDYNTMLVHMNAWPSSEGICVNLMISVTSPGENPGQTSYLIENAEITLPGCEIKIDPDADCTQEELDKVYGYNLLRDCQSTVGSSAAVFFQMVNEAKSPYTITETVVVTQTISTTATTREVVYDTTRESTWESRSSGQVVGLNKERCGEIVGKAADMIGNSNGVTTPWEYELLRNNLPAIHMAGNKMPLPILTELDQKKAKKAFKVIKQAPTICAEVIVR